jgi:riboflavin kinase/FMN adenylyltransferase
LEEGDVETSTHFLGRPYSLSGRVVKGDKIGRLMGFPTANIEIDSHYKLIPAEGIYAVTVLHESVEYGGMLYIGYRPTVGGLHKSIEVNIFDFDKSIYGESLIINFRKKIRGDSKFDDLETLKVQLSKDKEVAIDFLQSRKK